MITVLNDQQCSELLTATTIGRVGFVQDDSVQIIPVNYVVSGQDLLLRTAADGILHELATTSATVAFEVDHHKDIGGSGWSVLMHGALTVIPDDERPAVMGRVSPWAGEGRNVPLRFTIEHISGRSVHRDRH